MAIHAEEGAARRPLEVLGISEPEELLYRWLLVHPRATLTELAQALDLTANKARRLLAAIESQGLVTRVPEHPRRYLPISPDVALESAALRRQEDLRRARETINELLEQAKHAETSGSREQMVEVIASPRAARQIFDHMQRSAQREAISLVRPPMIVSRLDRSMEEEQETQRANQSRGVHHRCIVDEAFLALPNAPVMVREDVKSGQEYRLTASLPFKIFMIDRQIALVPLTLDLAENKSLLVRKSALLEALYALFEVLWVQATPIAVSSDEKLTEQKNDSSFPGKFDELVSLLAAGLNDKTIAYEMSISASTLNRRITEIMKILGARTRFQLGWLADRYLSGRLEQNS